LINSIIQMKPPTLTQDFLILIKKNKKYKTIANEIVLKEIKEYLRKNPKISKPCKEDIKEIRKNLYRTYSSYQTNKKRKRNQLLEKLKTNLNNKDRITQLLSIVISTKERLSDYLELYFKIFKITGKPKSIIDLGCGMNPLSYYFMNLKKLRYYAYDIDEEDIKFLNNFFKIMEKQGLDGKAKILDINNTKAVSSLPTPDIIFLFKVIDVINTKNHKTSEQLVKQLIKKTKFIIVSFATKTITRKSMNYPKRKGFELMLKRLNLKFKTIEIKNEIFYIISK